MTRPWGSGALFPQSVPPAAVRDAGDGGVKVASVGQEERPLGAEDDDVVCCRRHGEEEHFELKAHPEEDSTCDKRQDAAIDGVLGKRERPGGELGHALMTTTDLVTIFFFPTAHT